MTGDGDSTEPLNDDESLTTPGDEAQSELGDGEERTESVEDGERSDSTEDGQRTESVEDGERTESTEDEEQSELAADDNQTQSTEGEEITPQPPELRRQQYMVGIGAAVLAGVALAVGSFQQYPSLPTAVSIAAGIVGGGIVYWIVKNSLFPTADELSAE